ncbi:MAG: hypothetical protein M3443_19425 [Actinomycetota bacterium]|nr:hypothetical protein [Actinomycetota bacterium]
MNSGSDEEPNWIRLNGLNNLGAQFDATEVDTTDFDSEGWEDSLTTMRKAAITAAGFDGYTGADNAPVDDPAQAFLKTKGLATGPDAYVPVRLYRSDTLKGYTGRFSANYTNAGGEVKGAEPFNCNFTGAGELSAYTHTP